MAPGNPGHTRPPKRRKRESRPPKRKQDDIDINTLEEAVRNLDPQTSTPKSFTDLPLSAPTSAGLKAAHFSTLTAIQAQAIPAALRGTDILGAAKTGSGKTLAFLVPVLENLYRAQCVGAEAGLGALIISPTRELAIQIFEVLRKIGGHGHFFAAGLVIGGKGVREERETLARMNILVCTPGRILQHLGQTPDFHLDNLRMLVLDEADRIMDLGFQKEVDAILEYLPPDRQTLLFSATQTKRVSDLSRLALHKPEYISVHSDATASTPQTLTQSYILTPLPQKLSTLYSFLLTARKSKLLIFLSSTKQVRYLFSTFRQLQPGIPLLHLHGRQKQTQRLEIVTRFARAQHACLFATDVAARGLDFPAVDWVVQVDCPEDAETYIHRVGRTARFEKEGRAVLFLDPCEEAGMLARLEAKRVPIERINVREGKQRSVTGMLQGLLFKDPALKFLAQKAFGAYVRSLHVMGDKSVFRLGEYDLEGFARSLGLEGMPVIKFLKGDAAAGKRAKNAVRMGGLLDEESEEEGSEDGEALGVDVRERKAGVRTKYDRMFERRNQDVLAEHYKKMIRDEEEEEDGPNGIDPTSISHRAATAAANEDDDLFDIKRRIPASASDSPSSDDSDPDLTSPAPKPHPNQTTQQAPSNRHLKLLSSKPKKSLLKLNLPNARKSSRLLFDDAGNAHALYELEGEEDFRARGPAEAQRKAFLAEEEGRVKRADEVDKGLVREKKRVKKERRKERERREREGEAGDGGLAFGGEEDAMANFLADARGSDGDDDDDDDGVDGTPPSPPPPERKKKSKKRRFEDSAESSGDVQQQQREIETMDDLEAEAVRLLG